jgi:Flp pilus assembly protein TadG
MHQSPFLRLKHRFAGWLRSIAWDERGNVLFIVAAAIIPMLAIVGGGIDMGRGYTARTRLQEACDAGVLAARKKLGSSAIVGRVVPAEAVTVGNQFFRLNFRDFAYGTKVSPTFTMVMDTDFSIAGTASVNVPTTIMYLFGYAQLPVTVQCSSQFNYSNTDIMMVLDTTGSMNDTNPGDTQPKIVVLRKVVKDFYTAVETAKSAGVRVRYGFVPYSTNVNVGYLLKSKWMDTQGTYEGRAAVGSILNAKWRYASTPISFPSWTSGNSDSLVNGGSLSVKMGGSALIPTNMTLAFSGCIEERATYVIDDYANVDLTRARDLDIDSEPVYGNSATQWRPVLHEISWLRAVFPSGGYWSPGSVDNAGEYAQASDYGFTPCPSRARKLAAMTSSEVATYVDGLVPAGSTYHDIGMIWGGRLLSPTGIFASENVDVNNRPTMRHLIFLTDGETAPSEFSYGTYGIEPLSQRRWNSSSKFSLTQTVENRFTYACSAVKNKNITVWVVGFGTTMTPMLKNCAGSGHWFQANNATQLSAAFATIASAIGDLRIVK